MKKTMIIIAVVTFATVVGVGAYAHYEGYNRGWGMRGYQQNQQGMYGGRGGMMRGRRGGKWNSAQTACPCGAYGPWAPAQSGTAAQMISEEKAKEVAQEYLAKYLSGYTIDKVEKDNWRPMYFVTITGENNAVQLMIIHGFGGQVMHVYPQIPAQ